MPKLLSAGRRNKRIRARSGRRRNYRAMLETLERRDLLAANVVINEIHYDPAIKTEFVEFVELYNAGDEAAELNGWRLTNAVDFTFSTTSLDPGEYLVVSEDPSAVQSKFGVASSGPYTGKLSNAGDRVELRDETDLLVDVVDYGVGFPWPVVGGDEGSSIELVHPSLDNDLGGNWRSKTADAATNELFSAGESWRYFKGTAEPSAQGVWRGIGFDDSSWLSGNTSIGYGENFVVTNLGDMRNGYSTVYLRKSVDVESADSIASLLLKAQFDDGINVWINGNHVAINNVAAIENPHDGTAQNAIDNHDFVDFPLVNPQSYLVDGTNVIAVHLLNASLNGSSDATFNASLEIASSSDSPSPNAVNSVFALNSAPQLRQVNHWPNQPSSSDEVVVTVKASDPDGVGSVSLSYQLVNPGDYINLDDPRYTTDWTTLPMLDDGAGGDAIAGDDIYSVALDSSLQTHRRLIRYRITAEDAQNVSITAPYADDTQPNFAYFVYDSIPDWTGSARPGVEPDVTYSSEVLASVPTYHLITTRESHEDAQYIPDSSRGSGYTGSDYQWFGTMVYDGDVYDHVQYRARGGVWRYAMGKNMWKFDFQRGHGLEARDDYGKKYDIPIDKLNLSALIQQGNFLHRGEQGLFESVGFKLFNLTGVEGPNTNYVQFRIIENASETGATQFDSDFQGLYLALEQPDGNMLDEHELPDGNFYKMESGTGSLNNQGPTQPTDRSDLNSFLNTYNNSTPSEQWWRDNLDLDKYYSYRSIVEGIHHYDIANGKNYYYYHNPETDKWEVHPWDLDLTWANNMFGSGNEPFNSRVAQRTEFSQEYRNRLREIRDLLYNDEQAGMLIDEVAGFVYTPGQPSLVDADRAMWDYNPIMVSSYVNSGKSGHGRFYEQAATDDFAGMIQLLKDYVDSRGSWIDSTLLTDSATIPDTPTTSYSGANGFPVNDLRFDSSSFASNNGNFAGMKWRIAKVTDATLPEFDADARRDYEITADWESDVLTTFSSSITIPGDGLNVGDTYRVRTRMLDDAGRWSHWSDPVQFTAGSPTGPLQDGLRVTEIMFNPPASPPGDAQADNDEFEFIELQNISNDVLDISGVRIEGGIEFEFPSAPLTTLAPREFIVVVRNQQTFETRYDASNFVIAGEFTNGLSNSSDTIRVVDENGGEILDFDYRDGWYSIADGDGFSLVIRDTAAAVDLWDDSDGWRPSSLSLGNPGAADNGLNPGDIEINELLTHTDEVAGDWIELHNTTQSDINVGEWYLSDDPLDLTKFQIPANTMIVAGEFLVFTQTGDFGGSFGLSELGESLTLSGIGVGGEVGGYREVQTFGAAAREVTFGRHVNSDGDVDFTAMSAATSDDDNAAPLVGPIVINEIMYNPLSDNSDHEYIELLNIESSPTELFDPANPANTWAFLDGVDFVFPTGVALAVDEHVLVVPVDPVVFRNEHGIDPSIRIFGPFTGSLANNGESLELYRPGSPEPDGFVPMIRVEKVEYADLLPWPPQADGLGSSMSRILPAGYGNEPTNWAPSTNGGTPGVENAFIDGTPPSQPGSVARAIGSSTQIQLNWTASTDAESGVDHYVIYRNGVSLGTTASLSFDDTNAVAGTTYVYEVAAVNGEGLEGSKSASDSVNILSVASISANVPTEVLVTFTSSLDQQSAEDPNNYSIAGINIVSASLGVDNATVTLTTSELNAGQQYLLNVSTIESLDGSELPPTLQVNFAYLTDLELWLPLDEGQGTIAEDASGNDRDTNLNGGSWGPGQIAGGLQFDGNDYLSTGGVDLSQWLGGTATMAFWINTTQVGNNTAWQAPGISGVEVAGGANDVFWGWIDASGSIRISAANGSAASSSVPVNDGDWHHIALQRDSSNGAVGVFVDGVISDTAVSTSGLMTTAFTSIGRIEDTGGSPNHFVGELDDLRIYSRLLSEVEIEALAAFDVVAPRVQSVVISGENVDPADLPKGPSPTTWSQQRTMIDNLQINFTEPVSLTAADIRLVNLGVNAPVDADSDFVITTSHLSGAGQAYTLSFDADELDEGVYALSILSSVADTAGNALDGNGDGAAGDDYLFEGDATNKFYILRAEFTGDFGVSVFDFTTFSYWFGQSVGEAPLYADLNLDDGVSVFDFSVFANNFGKGVNLPVGFAAFAVDSSDHVQVPNTESEHLVEETEFDPQVPWDDLRDRPLHRETVDATLADLVGQDSLDALLEILAADFPPEI
jgi:hypothetical protein